MKHLKLYESFLNEAQMDIDPFDPDKFKVAAEMIEDKIGKPEKVSGLSFPEIKEVFGRDDYTLRYYLAQALLSLGRNYWPTNKYHGKDVQKTDRQNNDGMFTYYIGEAPHNEIMKKLGKSLLVTIKPLVLKIDKTLNSPLPAGYEFYSDLPIYKWANQKNPEVLKIKALVDKLPKSELFEGKENLMDLFRSMQDLGLTLSDEEKDMLDFVHQFGGGKSPEEYAEYLYDYYTNPGEYDIDENGDYYDMIWYLYDNSVGDHARYNLSGPMRMGEYKRWDVKGIENEPLYKMYLKMSDYYNKVIRTN